MSNLIRNTSLYAIGNIFPQAAGFLLLPIYTRYLTPADYGIVSSMQVLNVIIVVFFTLAIDRSVYRLYWDYKTEKERKDYLSSIIISLISIATILMALTFLFQKILGLIYTSIPFYPFYAYAILTAYFSIFALVPKIYLQLNEKAGSFVIVSIIQFVFSVAAILWFAVKLEEGAVGMLKGQMIGFAIMLPAFSYMMYKIINIAFKPSILKESLKFSLPMIPTLLSAWVLNLSDRIFIERYFSLADVGIYSLGYRIAGLVLILSSAFFLAYNPIFYKLADSDDQIVARKQLYSYNNNYVMVILMICFFVSLFSKEAVVILLDTRYAEAYKIVPIIALAYFVSQAGGLMNLSIYQEKKTIAIMLITIFGAVLNIGLNFVLVPLCGAYGAAVSAVLTFTGMFIVEYLYAKKCYFIDYDWKKIIIVLFVTVPIVSTVYITNINIYLSLIVKIISMACAMPFLYPYFYSMLKEMDTNTSVETKMV